MASKTSQTNAILLFSDEPSTLRAQIALLKKEAGIEEDSFDFIELEASESTAHEIFDAACSLPFLAKKKTVLVRRIENFGKGEGARLASQLENLPASALLILTCETLKENELPAETKQIRSTIQKIGEVLVVAPPKEKLSSELLNRAKKANLTIDAGALQEIISMTSGSTTDTFNEFEKLLAYCAKKGKITKADVREIVTPSEEWASFQMIDAICAGNHRSALQHLHVLLSTADKLERPVLGFLFTQIHKNLKYIFQARALSDKSVSLTSEASEKICPVSDSLKNIKEEWRKEKISQFASKLSLEQIAAMMHSLVQANMRFFGLLPSASQTESLQRMIVEMCDIASGNTMT